eukprot:scaffold484_cov148-Skeletonema_menzelii.AAC.6
MRLLWSAAVFAAAASSASAFAPATNGAAVARSGVAMSAVATADVKAKQDASIEKLKAKDASSAALSKDAVAVAFEKWLLQRKCSYASGRNEHIVVVSKPSGVLTVPGKDESNPSLNKAVFDRYGSESGRMDKMVVHRLGMDTSGLVVFARTNAALRGMNSLFRTRKVTRKYEALVCGHVAQDSGSIDLPLMRDYECPPFMRVSTDDHQRALIGLDAEVVGKKMLESPKESLTTYEVVSREDMDGNDAPSYKGRSFV